MCVLLFVAGLALALLAYWPVGWFVDWLRRESNFKEPREEAGVPPAVVGTFERLLAFALVVSAVPDALTVMGIWLGLKIAASWQVVPKDDNRNVRVGTLTGLMAGIVSVGFGVVGGWLTRWGCGS